MGNQYLTKCYRFVSSMFTHKTMNETLEEHWETNRLLEKLQATGDFLSHQLSEKNNTIDELNVEICVLIDRVQALKTLLLSKDALVDHLRLDILELEGKLVDAGISSHDEDDDYKGPAVMLDELITERNQLKHQARLLSIRVPLSNSKPVTRGRRHGK